MRFLTVDFLAINLEGCLKVSVLDHVRIYVYSFWVYVYICVLIYYYN